MKNMLKLAGAVVALGLSSLTAHATAITVDGGWVGFTFGAVGSGASGQPFTFSSAGVTTLTVADAFLSGDRFEVFNFGSSLGLTSAPTSTTGSGATPDSALLDPQWSSGSWVLGAGSYSITITTVASPHGSGGAYLRVDSGGSTVPDGSSTFVLALIGLVVALKARRFMVA